MLFNEYGEQHWWPGASPFEIMVGAILTQNTGWRNVEKAILNIKDYLTPRKLYSLPENRLRELIRPSGFFNVKTKRLRSFLKFLIDTYDGEIKIMKRQSLETLRENMLKVKGIGEETCDSILLYALNKPIFVVDAYTRRIFSRHKVFSIDATYKEIQGVFMSNLERDVSLYNEYHALIVRLGKERCKRKNLLCEGCPIKNFVFS